MFKPSLGDISFWVRADVDSFNQNPMSRLPKVGPFGWKGLQLNWNSIQLLVWHAHVGHINVLCK
jgi:hypothetical protein